MTIVPLPVAPRPHPRVVESTVDGSRVVFHLDDRRLHVLNPSAGAIWCALAEAATVGEVTLRVADRFGVDPATIRRDVEALIDRFRADGLVAGDDRRRAERRRPERPTPLGPGSRLPETGSYLGLDAALALECDDDEIGGLLDAVLHPVRSDRAPTTAITIIGTDPRWEIVVGNREPVVVASRLAVVLRVLAEVNDAAVRSAPEDLVFHAGAVTSDDGAALMPAASNHGKSTLTTALVAAGLGYLTDEAAAVTDDLVIRPFPKSIVLDPGSFPLFPELAPSPADGLGRALAGREWHIDARRVGSVSGPTPVRVVVCPSWRAGASTRVHRCSPADAMQLLLGEAFDFSEGGQIVFDRLAALVEDVPVYRLGYSDLREAVEQVRGLLAEPV